jgi:hypothetical protein
MTFRLWKEMCMFTWNKMNKMKLKKYWKQIIFLVALLLIMWLEMLSAQDLINTGRINNTGMFRVKNQVFFGGQDTLGGVFDYFGTNQTVPAKNYRNLTLSGSGIKQTSGGNFAVFGDITIAPAVTLQVETGSIMRMDGTLFENGYLSGSIQKNNVNLSGDTVTSTFGNIGATISWTGVAPGTTSVIRTSAVAVIGNGHQSIQRYYDITSAVNSGLNATLTLQYSHNELNGHDPAKLLLWKSIDGGQTWRIQGGIVDTSAHTITKRGISSFGRFTLSDSLHPLGSLTPVAGIFAIVSGNNQTDTIFHQLLPFVVQVTDSDGYAVKDELITFAIVHAPAGDSSAVINPAAVRTDSNGFASAVLKLGSKVGQYVVAAAAASISGEPLQFLATATVGSPRSLLLTSGNNQSGTISTTLMEPFVVTVTDSGGNAVSGTNVHFAITSTPPNASGQQLSVVDIATDSLGRAATILTLGNKVGQYEVSATSSGLNGSPVTFTATATVAAARYLTVLSGNNQIGTVGTTLPQPLLVSITDSGGNGVKDIRVQFAIVDTPFGATGQQLTIENAISDSLGLASTNLTLGSKAGFYRVTATSSGLSGSPATFSILANAGPAYRLAQTSGDNQSGLTNTILPQPLVVVVSDSFGNPVFGSTVRFAVVNKPLGAVNDSLTSPVAVTDSQGLAQTYLRLGDKAGVYTVQAIDSGLQGSPVNFSATAISTVAARLEEVSGNNQTDTVNTVVENPFVVLVSDASGNPVSGTTVNFQITSAPPGATSQSLSVTTAVSDSLGRASTVLTLGQKVGTYRVTASSGTLAGSPIEFTTTAIPASASTVAQVSGNNQQASILTQLTQPFVVVVTDRYGNVVPAAKVLFNITTTPAGATGFALSQDTVTTDSVGQAQVLMTLGSKVGIYTTTATIVGVSGSSVLFTSRANAGAAAVLAMTSGNSQTQDITTQLALPFVVSVTDLGGNAVQGTQVRFAISSTPIGARGHFLSDTLVVSDSLGTASSFLTLSHKVGTHTVTVTAPGLTGSPITFTAYATAFLGDANGDGRANIADLTTTIDKVLERIELSDANFTRADVDTNNVINTRDAGIILGGLLDGKWDSVAFAPEKTIQSAGSHYEAKFELTRNGLRFNLENDAPVKGIQFALRFSSATTIDRPDVVFRRSKHMKIPMQPMGNLLRVVLYNDDNTPIDTGSTSLFRLATNNLTLSDFDIVYVIVSTEANEGVYIPFSKVDGSNKYPDSYALLQNFPNPFNNQTTIRFQVPDVPGRFAPVLLQIFSVDGERIRTLVKGDFEAGTYDYLWDGTNDNGQVVSSGMYLYRLWTRDLMLVKKLMFIK